MGPRPRPPLLPLLLLLPLLCSSRHISPRRSCRDHFLAGHHQSGVFPIRLHPSSESFPVECRMPSSGDVSAVVVTVVHSAIERATQVTQARTVQWQISHIPLLQDILNRGQCTQYIHYNRVLSIVDGAKSGVTLQSIMNMESSIPLNESGRVELRGPQAGVLHILPEEDNCIHLPSIRGSVLECSEPVASSPSCVIDGGVEIDLSSSSHSHFRFSFYTDISDQTLFAAKLDNGAAKVHADLLNDYFLSLGPSSSVSSPPHLVGHLSDGRWHTVQIYMDATHMSIDGGDKMALPQLGTRLTSVDIKLQGIVLLSDHVDEATQCNHEEGRLFFDKQPSLTRPFCRGSSPCECTLLPSLFHFLPSPTCDHLLDQEQDAVELLRHSELLSFILLPDVLSPSSPLLLSLTFKSDSDSGLLLFGEWRHSTWGRMQVHYHDTRLTAMHCTQEDENSHERCQECSVEREAGFNTDTWTRVVLFELSSEERFLAVDGIACQLKEEKGEFDTAELYKTGLTKGSVLFIGGMFNKKVRHGIYREDFKAKYFENTREKLPSLRGCIKDLFTGGSRVDLLTALNTQRSSTLVEDNEDSYAVRMGCGTCPSECGSPVRCRPSSPSLSTPYVCDCSDIEMYPTNSGRCQSQTIHSLSLAQSSMTTYRGPYALSKQWGQLSKIWLKIRLPSSVGDSPLPLVNFLTHGNRVIFRLALTPSSRLVLRVNPDSNEEAGEDAEKEVSLSDDRIHLIKIVRRSPLGTHPNRLFFDVFIDGTRFSIKDPLHPLTSIEFSLIDALPEVAGCVSDLGVSYDYDEHRNLGSEHNKITTVNVLKEMMYEIPELPSANASVCGILDPSFWHSGIKTAPIGVLLPYDPTLYMEHAGGPLSAEWLLYSLLLTIGLCLLVVLCLLFYFCCLRRKRSRNRRRNSDDDRERIMHRDSPDYPVLMRKDIRVDLDNESCISDSLDRENISAYDDVQVHKVKVDRESMISFLEPTGERMEDAFVVTRTPSPPSAPSDAPLVRIVDIGQ